MKTIGIIGSRTRVSAEDLKLVKDAFNQIYEEGDRIISGGCPTGGDHFAEMIAKDRGLTIIIHYPNWKKYGRGAGFQRNTLIAQGCDILIALTNRDKKGGAEDTIEKAEILGRKVIKL